MIDFNTVPRTSPLEEVRKNEWRLFQVYLFYRLVLGFSLLTAHFFSTEKNNTIENDTFYLYTAILYTLISIINLLVGRLKLGHLSIQAFIVIITDIIAIAILEHSNNTSDSNLMILLVVTVAAGGILVEGRLASFFAAVATLVVLYKQILNAILEQTVKHEDFIQSAFIGIACFATSILAQIISKRMRESAVLAGQQAEDLANLEELNHYVIQRMRTGIVVVDSHNRLILINDACWKMFGMPNISKQTHLENISPELTQQLYEWRKNNFARCPPFRTTLTGPEVQVNFTQLETGIHSNVLIFADDNTRMSQQAQQLKLASLGGLTASIAHEIRNPLGAISHAAQLLQESDEISNNDARLTEIINQHCMRMNKVIENVLQLSRRKQAEPELLVIKDWINHFINEFKVTQPNIIDIQFSCRQPNLSFRIDPSQIHQVLTNLFNNGLRYSEQSTGKRCLQVVADINIQTEQPTLDIIDRGPGIPEAQQDKIFEPFYTSEKSGTGLGLYIARELCESNQARLDYLPVKNGSCFRITFLHPDRIVPI